MVRFLLYVLTFAISAAALGIIWRGRRASSPRSMALIPALTLTATRCLFLICNTLVHWIEGAWWQEPTVSPALATLSNAVILTWVLTALIIVPDKKRHQL